MPASFAQLPDIDAALFDLDGTLVETNIDFTRMKRETVSFCSAHGAEPSALSALDILAAIDHTARLQPQGRQGTFRQRAWELLEGIEIGHLAGARARPYAGELLTGLHERNRKIAIVTRNCRKATNALLALLPDVVDLSLAREDVPRTKPDPLHIHTALEQLGVQARRSLMAGDHPMDVRAGREAGCITVGLLFEREPGYFDSCGPHAALADLKALADAIFHPDR